MFVAQFTTERSVTMAQSSSSNFYVIGIGTSAGGLEALEKFFTNMPPDEQMAFVVVQHLSPDYESHMVELQFMKRWKFRSYTFNGVATPEGHFARRRR